MPRPLSGIIEIIDCFLIGFIAGAGWTLSAGLLNLLKILFSAH